MSRGRDRLDLTNSASPGGPVGVRTSQQDSLIRQFGIHTFVFGIAGQHTLYADTYALNVVHRAPALIIQKIQTYDAVGVDVRMHRDLPFRVSRLLEDNLGCFDRICCRELQAQAELLVRIVNWVVRHLKVHLPLSKIRR